MIKLPLERFSQTPITSSKNLQASPIRDVTLKMFKPEVPDLKKSKLGEFLLL